MFEWDEAKSKATLERRGFDFDFAKRIFDRPILETDDDRIDYGEHRIRAIGRANSEILLVVYT
jgi:uncharacterized protein